jgi:hypothetical protein
MLPEPAQSEEEIKAAAEVEAKLGYEYRKKTLIQMLEDIKNLTDNNEIKNLAKFSLVRLHQYCEEVASRVDDIPRTMGMRHASLRDVFEQVAESIRDIPDAPQQAVLRAQNVKYDASRIPELSSEVRREGYEEGYRDGRKNHVVFTDDVDIDID